MAGGKTPTLVARIAWLVATGTPSDGSGRSDERGSESDDRRPGRLLRWGFGAFRRA